MRPGSYPRGEDTRRRILDTAIELFGSEGYGGTSTRMLAERAGVNLPAIQYYFGNKEGLYRAAIDHISGAVADSMAVAAEHAGAVLANLEASQPDLLDALTRLTDAFVLLTLGEKHEESRKLFIARAEVENIAALDSLHETMIRHVATPCMALVGRLLGRKAHDELVVIKTVALLGQVIIFCRTKAQRALGWSDIDGDRAALIQSVIRDHTAAIIHASAQP